MRLTNPSRHWNRVFLVTEAYVVGVSAIVYGWRFATGRRIAEPTHWFITSALGLYAISVLFLMIASPFFIRSLKHVALAGWIIGFGLVLTSMLTPALSL